MSLDTRVSALMARYVDLDSCRRELVDELDSIKVELRELLGPGKHATPHGYVSVQRSRRFDPERAARVCPDALRPLIVRERVVPQLAKEHLPPALYAQCQSESDDYTVRVL